MHNSTAAPAPSIAADETAPIVPVKDPEITETVTIPAHIHAITIEITTFQAQYCII